MSLWDLVNHLGALATAGMGGLGFLAPKACARLVGLKARSPAGFSEFRATYGGLFLALGLAPLITGEPAMFLLSGLGWAAAAAGRVVSLFADKSFERTNLAAVGVELAFASLLLVGNPGLAF